MENHFKTQITIPENFRANTFKFLKVNIPGIHMYNDHLFNNYYLVFINLESGEVEFYGWPVILEHLNKFEEFKDKLFDKIPDRKSLPRKATGDFYLAEKIESQRLNHIWDLVRMISKLTGIYEQYTDPK